MSARGPLSWFLPFCYYGLVAGGIGVHRMLPNSGKYHWPKDIKVTDGYAYSTVLNQYITPTTFLSLLFAAHTPNYHTHYISKLYNIYPIFHNEGKQIWRCRCSLLSHMLTVVMTRSSSLLRLLSHSFSPLLLWVQPWASPYVHLAPLHYFHARLIWNLLAGKPPAVEPSTSRL
jgi:hypothetical protein